MDDLNGRLANLFARGVIRHADVRAGLQTAQVEMLAKERRRLEMPQGYGLASAPLAGAEAFAMFAGGRRDNGVIVAWDDGRHRPRDLLAGEVMLYTHQHAGADGHGIKLGAGRKVDVACDEFKVSINGSNVTMTLDANGIRWTGLS